MPKVCFAVACLQGAVWSCALDPSATLAATGSADFSAMLWDALNGLERHSFQHKHIVRSCGFSPSSMKLATGGGLGSTTAMLVTVGETLHCELAINSWPCYMILQCPLSAVSHCK
jgi:WD40 repeat protein